VPDNVPVSGKVMLDGQPLAGGQVSYVPFDKDQATSGMSAGQIDPSGGYVIYTGGKEGAPPGRYKVTVTPSMTMAGDHKDDKSAKDPKAMMASMMPFNTKFSDPARTTLVITVSKDAPPGTYDLKLTK